MAYRAAMNTKNKITDYDIESVMGTLLIAGVVISGAVVLFGGICYLYQMGNSLPHYKTFRGALSNLRSVKQILHGVMHFDSLAIIQLGLVFNRHSYSEGGIFRCRVLY